MAHHCSHSDAPHAGHLIVPENPGLILPDKPSLIVPHKQRLMTSVCCGVPKAELHIHIEGTLEPDLMFRIARRNQLVLPYKSMAELRAKYNFTDLQSFLDIYYKGCDVLLYERDFYDLAMAYFRKISRQNVRHVELFFDPQTHTNRGVSFETVISGLRRAQNEAKRLFNISSHLIMCFVRHEDADAAMKTLVESLPFKHWITAVGLDSGERGRPPELFTEVFEFAIANGYKTVAHAGEEGPADYIWQALELLKVSRVDHGVRCVDDPVLVNQLARTRMPLTMCPWSSLRLRVVDELIQYPIRLLLELGLCVSMHSDDPAYFGKYINGVYVASQRTFRFTLAEIRQLAKNSFEASFISAEEQANFFAEVDAFMDAATSK
jgi:adenine deaminase